MSFYNHLIGFRLKCGCTSEKVNGEWKVREVCSQHRTYYLHGNNALKMHRELQPVMEQVEYQLEAA